MPPLIVYNGGLLVRSGALSASTDCCCSAGCCCIEGYPDSTKTTQAECESAGGRWVPNVACSPEACLCPATCPPLDGCNLVLIRDYGTSQFVDRNSAVEYWSGCTIYATVPDIPFEHGGDYDVSATIGYDANCCPILEAVSFSRSAPCDGSDPLVNCVKVIVRLECSGTCCSQEWVFEGDGSTPTVNPCNPFP